MPNIVISNKTKDSGERRVFSTGSKRDMSEGKGRFDLLPTRALTRLARLFERGAIKYGVRNWEKGLPLSSYMDSALRHGFKYVQGMRDEDHLIALVWNGICCAETEERIALGLLPAALNDLPEPEMVEEQNGLKLSPEAINFIRLSSFGKKKLALIFSVDEKEIEAIRRKK